MNHRQDNKTSPAPTGAHYPLIRMPFVLASNEVEPPLIRRMEQVSLPIPWSAECLPPHHPGVRRAVRPSHYKRAI